MVWGIASINDRMLVRSSDPKDIILDYERSGERDAHKLLPWIESDFVVMDFGIGGGRVEKYLYPHVKEIHGFDISQGMLKKAKERLSDCPNVYLHKTRGNRIEFSYDNFFDFAFSIGTLQHIHPDDTCKILSDIYKVIKLGGKAYLQFTKDRKPSTRAFIKETAIDEVVKAGFAVEDIFEDTRSIVVLATKKQAVARFENGDLRN